MLLVLEATGSTMDEMSITASISAVFSVIWVCRTRLLFFFLVARALCALERRGAVAVCCGVLLSAKLDFQLTSPKV